MLEPARRAKTSGCCLGGPEVSVGKGVARTGLRVVSFQARHTSSASRAGTWMCDGTSRCCGRPDVCRGHRYSPCRACRGEKDSRLCMRSACRPSACTEVSPPSPFIFAADTAPTDRRLRRAPSFARDPTNGPAIRSSPRSRGERRMVEAAGIEPASESSLTTASTCVVCLLESHVVVPNRQGAYNASRIRSRSRTLRRRTTSQPAKVGAPVRPCRRGLAERAT